MDVADSPPPLRQTPDWQTAELLHRLDRSRRAGEQLAGLGIADLRLMWLFSDRRPRTLREVAEALNLEQSTVNRQVNTALGEGLLRRFREAGRSARSITATDEGLERFEQDVALHLGISAEALDAVGSPDDQQEFKRLLGRFVDAYAEAVTRRQAGWARAEAPHLRARS
jgi:DNA-binding MarR family transcriptional regulator